jgi:two-component system, NarL family, response regulator LiaR
MYGSSLAAILFLLKWLEYRFIIIDHAFEIYITCIAIVFTALGIWLTLRLSKTKVETRVETIVVEKEVYIQNEKSETAIASTNEAERERLGISNRELEVLQLMSEGLSNQEIADRLFVSVNTIKTHSSKVFEKLDARRRTQAIEKAKRLNIIA